MPAWATAGGAISPAWLTTAGRGRRHAAHAAGPLPRVRLAASHPVPGTADTTGWAEYRGRRTDPGRRSAGWASRAFPAGLPPPEARAELSARRWPPAVSQRLER